jgi:hypothetical protein
MSTTDPWTKHQVIVKKYLEENGYENFLREPTIKGTMFVGDNETTRDEYCELVKNINYDKVWKHAIRDSGFGNPERFPFAPYSSGNYIHCAYHLAKFEEAHGVAVKDLDHILEVGAGYGAMATVCRQAGFTGKYVCFDLPIFSDIQRIYIGKNGYEYITISEIRSLIGDMPSDNSMFISTWAVSEMPEDYRMHILNQVPKYKNVLLAYQSFFEGMDINGFFDEWQKQYEQYSWVNMPCADEDHKYLFGRDFYA